MIKKKKVAKASGHEIESVLTKKRKLEKQVGSLEEALELHVKELTLYEFTYLAHIFAIYSNRELERDRRILSWLGEELRRRKEL